jgi:AcrR family transcriptional regulator
MPRPSRHLDRALLAAGRELLPVHGLSGLTIRQVCEAAGVNIGMFHYHFRTRETFLKALLQGAYEEMFSTLSAVATRQASWSATLRAALGVLGRFLLANRTLMARVLAEALAGDAVARSFLQENFPRHLRLITGMLVAGQAAGEFRPMAPMQAFAFCAGAVGLAPLIGGAILESGVLDEGFRTQLLSDVLTESAIDQRVDLALAALHAGELATPPGDA